jgi:CubicO group peptidase (beta-lactamase class C family)
VRRRVDDYVAHQRVTGLLVIKDGAIVLERYGHGRGPATRFLSASMAKSLVGLLVAIALHEGHIRSLSDPASAYVPALAGHPYGATAIRDLLQMSTRFSERAAERLEQALVSLPDHQLRQVLGGSGPCRKRDRRRDACRRGAASHA